MLTERFFPKGTPHYKYISRAMMNFDMTMAWKPVYWFGIWTLFVAGMGSCSGYYNRYVFWDFSRWFTGLAVIAVITTLSVIFLFKNNILNYDQDKDKNTNLIIHSLIGFVVFLIGWGGGNLTMGALHSLPYVLTYLAIIHIYKIQISDNKETGEKYIIFQNERRIYSIISLMLFVISAVIGFILDDPVISTASVVAAPFSVVSFFMNHHRHVLRARVFPILIISLFVATRQSWFLIPLLILFYFLRVYHYFRFGVIYPTFSVNDNTNHNS